MRRFWATEALACNEALGVKRWAEGCEEAGECVRGGPRYGRANDERRGARDLVVDSSRGVMARCVLHERGAA